MTGAYFVYDLKLPLSGVVNVHFRNLLVLLFTQQGWEPLTRIGNSVFLRCFVIMLAFRSQSEAAAVKNNIELCATLSTITKQLKYENDTSIVLSNIMDYHEMRYADMV